MPTITDKEFGEIKLARSARASHVRIRVGTDGKLRASMPLYAPVMLVKRLINTSRPELRNMLNNHHSATIFTDLMPIGKSHSLIVRQAAGQECEVHHHGQQVIVSLPERASIEESRIQMLIRPVVIAALRKEAKSYLPRRLAYLAKKHGFSYQKVRFSHASGRWGSCSSNGTISLNIALMKLPFPLIDYVLLHELSHTEQMNHSSTFWELVEQCDPEYKTHRRLLKQHTPSI